MESSELVENIYSRAVEGIQKNWFLNRNTDWYDYVVSLPIELKITYLVIVVHNQVVNGGFHQYFVNGYGQFAKETIIALLDIGASKRAKLLEKSFEMVNNDNISIEVFRERLLDKDIESFFISDELYEPLDELDTQYYNIIDEEIDVLLGNYLGGR
ncbi:DMP19 family protein [Mucilaginibacter myungsuensis]|uniref:DUF4375 domain-containing protein n=1 Tax=Mucilaginibacter myungsuensis TaxID=649104 RepID=A0A929KYL0_9SPHI|nr:DUF4375 domain-containing protein [Mucilaginibacter myungsuensis]MBE9663552.1 DUF4375 domain-containing protein [Mucilaginibacter myungsuensis]MDN3600290.1 DUF4375 domain-containing protein [Mucilaginibacter myungsuensis]